MNNMDKIRAAIKRYLTAEQNRGACTASLRTAEEELTQAEKELARQLHNNLPGRALVCAGVRYRADKDTANQGPLRLTVESCDDVILT